MVRMLSAGCAVMLAIALLSQAAPVAEAANARGPMMGPTMQFYGPAAGPKGRAGARNFTGSPKKQGIMLLPAVQKIRDAAGGGGGGGGGRRPKPKEDCMSCAD